MRLRPVHLLFAAALFAAQGLALAHSFEHAVIGHADHASVICAHGHVPGYLPGTAIIPITVGAALPVPVATAATLFVAAPAPAFRIRAPPFLA